MTVGSGWFDRRMGVGACGPSKGWGRGPGQKGGTVFVCLFVFP